MSNDRYDNIADYLNGAMPVEDRILFEKEMLEDDRLREDVNIFKALQAALQDDEQYANNDAALSEAFTKLNKDFFKPDNSASYYTRKKTGTAVNRERVKIKWLGNPLWQTAAAAVLIGIIILIAVWFMRSEKNNEQPLLVRHEDSADTKQHVAGTEHGKSDTAIKPGIAAIYARHFTIDKPPAQIPDELIIAFSSLTAKNYTDAADAFKAARPTGEVRGGETDLALLFYIDYYSAQCAMEMNKTSEAISKLQQALKESPDNFSKAKAHWYLALAYLKNGDIEKAKQILNALSAKSKAKEYQAQSIELLKELE